jgi:hypothetical protein
LKKIYTKGDVSFGLVGISTQPNVKQQNEYMNPVRAAMPIAIVRNAVAAKVAGDVVAVHHMNVAIPPANPRYKIDTKSIPHFTTHIFFFLK